MIPQFNPPKTETTFKKRTLKKTFYNFKTLVCTTTAKISTAQHAPNVFCGKSERIERYEDLFKINIEMYPPLTEIQKKLSLTLQRKL